MRYLILMCGRKRTGKETAFKTLRDLLLSKNPSLNIQEFQFSTPLKKFCIETLGLRWEHCYGSDQERESPTQYVWGDGYAASLELCEKYGKKFGTPMSGREVLQVVGTDLFRNLFSKDIWAKAGLRSAAESDADVAVFTDVRFENEIQASREFPCFDKQLNIRLYRETGLEDSHNSESALDAWDFLPNQRRLNPETAHPDYTPVNLSPFYRTPYLLKSTTIDAFGSHRRFQYLIDNNHSPSLLRQHLDSIIAWEDLCQI